MKKPTTLNNSSQWLVSLPGEIIPYAGVTAWRSAYFLLSSLFCFHMAKAFTHLLDHQNTKKKHMVLWRHNTMETIKIHLSYSQSEELTALQKFYHCSLSVVFKVVKNETIELCSPHAQSSASQAKEEYVLCSQHRL